jgi:membrane peptidoglycan carboxypeptidase
MAVDSPIDLPLQNEVERLFHQMVDPRFVKANGLNQERLLHGANPSNVIYSLILFERTPQGNILRVQADNLDRPLDINDGVKLDLGSTAKLRTLAHYLEIVGLLYDELSTLDGEALTQRARAEADPITHWAADTLRTDRNATLETVLERALDRKYSATPYEAFFTGSGLHSFQNFDKDDNGRILTVRHALRTSTNLVFIRLMRDLVRFHRDRLDYDSAALLADPQNPARIPVLERAADEEARALLHKAYRRYRHQDTAAVVRRLLGRRADSPRHLSMLFFAWHHGATVDQLGAWLRERLGKKAPPDNEISRLAGAYGGEHLTLSDYGYLLSRHPLDVWSAGRLAREPELTWLDLLAQSGEERKLIANWLLRTRNRSAQDTRLRIRIEQDAFARMTPYWQRLGFPFDHLVPTYATAIGNSSDRPTALADLMGIIANDGVRLPMLRLTQVHWGAGTPYETVMVPAPTAGERVMKPEVARALRRVLSEVVEMGTARRVAGAFRLRDGTRVTVGGKTGSGDNRFKTFNRYGGTTSSRAVNRTATFAFYIGDRYFGVLTSFVPGQQANRYSFTSALSVSVLKLLAPLINPRLDEPPVNYSTDLRWAGAPAPAPLPETATNDLPAPTGKTAHARPEAQPRAQHPPAAVVAGG